jgi:hypothetical protein
MATLASSGEAKSRPNNDSMSYYWGGGGLVYARLGCEWLHFAARFAVSCTIRRLYFRGS